MSPIQCGFLDTTSHPPSPFPPSPCNFHQSHWRQKPDWDSVPGGWGLRGLLCVRCRRFGHQWHCDTFKRRPVYITYACMGVCVCVCMFSHACVYDNYEHIIHDSERIMNAHLGTHTQHPMIELSRPCNLSPATAQPPASCPGQECPLQPTWPVPIQPLPECLRGAKNTLLHTCCLHAAVDNF